MGATRVSSTPRLGVHMSVQSYGRKWPEVVREALDEVVLGEQDRREPHLVGPVRRAPLRRGRLGPEAVDDDRCCGGGHRQRPRDPGVLD
ncbi:MAG TPA: hypothetical protein VNT52_18625, partial [Acidimicrobiales bacterium]|nr:hypothetical protein [Acidimicrobiales bacterium]